MLFKMYDLIYHGSYEKENENKMKRKKNVSGKKQHVKTIQNRPFDKVSTKEEKNDREKEINHQDFRYIVSSFSVMLLQFNM